GERAAAVSEQQREQRREELRAANEVCLFSDWTLQRDGTMACRVEWNGRFHEGDERRLRLPFDTPGFVQRANSVHVLDGHGRELPGSLSAPPAADRGGPTSPLPESGPAEGYPCATPAELDGADGLLPARDGYVLRLPMKRGYRVAQVHSLTLPEGCRVDDAQPPPSTWSADRRTLTWEQTEGQIETAVIRCRCDGALGTAFAARKGIEERTRRFLGDWYHRIDDLGDWLDREFVCEPGSLDRAAVVRSQPR